MKKLYTLLILFSAAIHTSSIIGQDSRPKVGLVLSGGSAHGIAHIGVLRALEEQNVHVDYITGTSMGSIIGGLYAMGMTADEIQDLTEQQNWSELLAIGVPLNEIAPSEKLYHNKYALTFELRDGGVKLPEGFLNSQKLDLELNRMFCPAHDINDFDSLSYPFKCVAVNIENGDIEIIDKGYLGTAVRSSMAIPSVFAPVEMDNKLLVDGGLIRNFPVDEVLAMGADIVIGVYVGSKLEEKNKLNNLLEILNQSAFMMGVLDSEEQKKKVDILIEPDVKALPSFGFELSDELIREGYIAATRQIEAIKELGDGQSSFQIDKPDPLPQISSLKLADTRFPFIRSPFDALANFKYGARKKGSINLDQIERGIGRIFGTKHFDNINYTFKTDGHNGKILAILAKPRKLNQVSATFNFMPSSSTSLLLTSEMRNTLDEPSVLYTTLRLAENYGIKLDYNYRLGLKKDFILSAFGQVHRYDQNLYEDEVLREQYAETNARFQIGVGYEPNNTILVQGAVGVEGFYFKPVGIDENGLSKYQRADLFFRGGVSFDNIDAIQFPKRGVKIGIDAAVFGPVSKKINSGTENTLLLPNDKFYVECSLKGTGAYELSKGVVAEMMVSGGFKSQSSLLNNFRVGGLENRDHKSISMLGLNTHQLHLDQYMKGGLGIRFELFNNVFLSLRGDYLKGRRTFVPIEVNDNLDISLFSFGSILGFKTPLGPIQLAYGRNSLTESWNTNFTFGYSFF